MKFAFVVRRPSCSNEFIDSMNQLLIPFVAATKNLVHLNKKWQEQLKNEKERARRTLITGSHDTADDPLDVHAAKHVMVTVMNPISNDNNSNQENNGSIPPVVLVRTNVPTQKSIADEFTLNTEQRAAFMIITSHLDGDSRCRAGICKL